VATARERLLQALTAIISQPYGEDGKTALNRLLNSYRVQAKPGESIDKSSTARDELEQRIIATWQQNHCLDKKSVARIISSFRMQLKHGVGKSRISDVKQDQEGEQTELKAQGKSLTRSQIKENINKHENAYFKDRPTNSKEELEPSAIAGGPKQGSNSRGQCPKCRSLGIVLARAYGGDDYHSCIYCGYQAYLKGADPKLDLPMAAELLGHAFVDADLDDEE